MWNNKENSYDSTDVNYNGGVKYGSDIHHIAVKTNQIVWDMIKVLNKKKLFGFHFSAKLGTKRTIIYITHEDEEQLEHLKRSLREFYHIDGVMILAKVRVPRGKNSLKRLIIWVGIIGVALVTVGGIGYYLYAKANFFTPSNTNHTSTALFDETTEEGETIEVDIEALTALKESFEKYEKSETEKMTLKAMMIATDVIAQTVPDSLKEKYSSEEVVRKFKGKGGVNIVLKDTNESSHELNQSINELNNYAINFAKENNYDGLIKQYDKQLETNEITQAEKMNIFANKGELYEMSGKFEEANASFHSVYRNAQTLAKKDPIKYTNTQAWALAKVTAASNEFNQTEQSSQNYEDVKEMYIKTVKLFRDLAKKNPRKHLQNLAWSYNMLANFYHHELKDFDESIENRKKALRIYKPLLNKSPSIFYERLFRTYNSLAESYKEMDGYKLAETTYLTSLNLTQSMQKDSPQEYNHYLAESMNQFGALYTQMEMYTKAYKELKKAENLYKKLNFEDSKNYSGHVLGVQQDIAELYSRQNKYQEAEKLYRTVIKGYQGLNQERPLKYTAMLAKALNSMAWIALNDKTNSKLDEAYSWLSSSLEVSKKLKKIDYRKYQSLTSTSYIYWAYLSLVEGNTAQAFKKYEKALSLSRKYETSKSYLMLVIAQKNYMKANDLFTSMLKEYTTKSQQAELWMLYGKFYMSIDVGYAQKKLENALKLYQELNDTLKVEALKILLEHNSSIELQTV